MSDRQMTKEFATWFFALFFRGEHHIPGKVKPWGTGWAVYTNQELATWDFATMTRLVVMAHDNHVRASFVPQGMSKAYLAIHPRPAGNNTNEHPALEWHIDKTRKWIKDFDEAYLKGLKIKAIPDPPGFVPE